MGTVAYLGSARKFDNAEMPQSDNYHSVEIRVDKAGLLYQFKIWKIPTSPNFVLVKQESDILNWIHPGDILRMTYCSDNTAQPKKQLPTQILNINRHDAGRFRGHYIVTLSIVEN